MKRFLILGILFSLVLSAFAVEAGKTYRIWSKKYPSRSLFVRDSQRAAGADVVLWTDTDVPSAQWTLLAGSNGTFIMQNVYSENVAAPATRTAGGTFHTDVTRSNGRVIIEAVDGNTYRIHNNNAGALSLAATDDADGSLPAWSATVECDDAQLWVFEEVEPKTEFTAAMRDEMLSAYISNHLHSRGSSFRTFYDGSWGEAEQLEVLLDAYETTGDEQYLRLARYVYAYFNSKVGSDWTGGASDGYKWYGYDYNDDVMWMVIAVARLGYLSGTKSYTNAAKANFDRIYSRAYIPFTGLLRWAEQSGDRYGTNSCINGPAEVAACYLGMSGAGEEYFEKARDLYAAQRKVLTQNMATGKVLDNVVWDPETETVKSKNEWASTYNQGTMLGAACLLYLHYNEAQYLSDARKIMNYTKNELCDDYGIVRVCQDPENQDLCGFKGILMRYVRIFVNDLGQSTYKDWMLRNALRAYCNRAPSGLTGTAWLKKSTDETTANPFGCSTAASAAANAPVAKHEDAIISLPRTSTQSAATPSAFYSLSGTLLASPPSRGFYIVRQAGKNKKLQK